MIKQNEREQREQAYKIIVKLQKMEKILMEIYRENSFPFEEKVKEKINRIENELFTVYQQEMEIEDFYNHYIIQNCVYALDYLLAVCFIKTGNFPKKLKIEKFFQETKETIKEVHKGDSKKLLDRGCVNEKIQMLAKSRDKCFAEELIRDFANECRWIGKTDEREE